MRYRPAGNNQFHFVLFLKELIAFATAGKNYCIENLHNPPMKEATSQTTP
jgi:hypothetical protein